MGVHLPPIDLGPGRWARKLVAGNYHVCALLDDGSVKCWGRGSSGQLGQGSSASIGSQPNQMGENLPPIDLGTGRRAVDIAAGGSQSCAVLDDGSAKCWGDGIGDSAGEMGDNLQAIDMGGRTVKQIAASTTYYSSGDSHACAVLDDSSVKCWGDNSQGQLGQGTTSFIASGAVATTPAIDVGGRRVTKVVTGGAHTCVLFDTGNMACWGDGSRGQVGHGSTSDIGAMPGQMGANLPLVDLGNHTVLDIDAHLYYTCALLDDSSMKCWGNTLNGRTFHHGDEPNEMGANLPKVDLGSQASPQQISSGLWHRCALLKDCSLKCWGMNAWGRLGYGDQVNRVDDDPSRMGDNLPSVELVINTSPHTDCSSVTTSRSTTTTATMTTTSTPDLCASPGQCVVYKGYEYRTLDGTFPDSNSAGYQDYWLPLPDGWEIAPWEEDVRAVAEGHPWGAHRIVHSSTTREHCSCTPLYTSCECSWGSGRIYGTRTVDNVTEYKTSHNDRILIRRPSGTTTTSTTALTWQLVVSGHGSTSQVAAATYSDQMVIYGGGSQLWRLDLEAGAWQSIAATGT
ncbi:UVR8, partial [Symbiodinium microadriaticum]